MTVALDPHVTAIVGVLAAGGLTVGDGEGRKDSTGKVIAPQVIVYPIPGGFTDGSLAEPDGWADCRFQLTSVGRVAAEARRQLDLAWEALEASSLAVPGRRILRLRPIDPMSRVERDHDITPAWFYATRVFGFHTFPAT